MIYYTTRLALYKVTRTCELGYARKILTIRVIFANNAIQQGSSSVGSVVQAVLDKTDVMDETLRHLITAMFNSLHNLLECNLLYCINERELEDCPGEPNQMLRSALFPWYFIRGRYLLQICWKKNPQDPITRVVELSVNLNAVKRTIERSLNLNRVQQTFTHGLVPTFRSLPAPEVRQWQGNSLPHWYSLKARGRRPEPFWFHFRSAWYGFHNSRKCYLGGTLVMKPPAQLCSKRGIT